MDVDLCTRIANSLAASMVGWGSPSYIDAGASGAVYSVDHPTYGKVALKVYDPTFFKGKNALIEEKRVELQVGLTEIEHDHLIRTFHAEKIPKHGTWYLLMEFCPWPSLEKVVSSVPDGKVPELIKQLAEVVIFLRDNSYVHRDIKPANIAVSDDFTKIKLLDLGVLRKMAPDEGNGTDIDEKKRFVATAQYSPPDYIAREEEPGSEGFEALNVYQVGAVLHDMLMKKPLFDEEALSLNRYILYRAIMHKIPTVFNSSTPARLNSLCRAALSKNPTTRTRAVQLEDFVSASEDVEAVRRRVAAQKRPSGKQRAPSLLEWKSHVETWVASAARAERELLGACQMKEAKTRGVASWHLSFDEHGGELSVLLAPDVENQRLLLRFGGRSDVERRPAALEILHSGPNIPKDQVRLQLREQILYALDSLPLPDDEVEI